MKLFDWRRLDPVFFVSRCLLVVWAGCLAGCGNRSTPENASGGEALYAAPTPTMATNVLRAMTLVTNVNFQKASFASLQTELSPAVVYHTRSNDFHLFTDLPASGLGGPTFASFAGSGGPRSIKVGERVDGHDLQECWILVSFSGAKGWTNWDSPWAVFLERRPSSIKVDDTGLHLHYAGAAGTVVVMPFYGYSKPPQAGRGSPKPVAAARGSGKKKETIITTSQWNQFLPVDVLQRVRYWAGLSREIPIYCQESFSLNPAHSSITLRQQFQWLSIQDDWQTRSLKIAPLSPTLALAHKSGGFPLEFSQPPVDLDYATPYGPYMGMEGAESVETTFKVLNYLQFTEAPITTLTNPHPSVAAALGRLRQAARDQSATGLETRTTAGDLVMARALPYLEGDTRINALSWLKRQWETVLAQPMERSESARLLPELWAYAHYSGDWTFVRDRWELIRSLLPTARESKFTWAGFGREEMSVLAEESSPYLALARLACQVGDSQTCDYASYLFARELVMQFVQQRGVPYFRERQPWHGQQPMSQETAVTFLKGGVAGWQLEGPAHLTNQSNPWFTRRWDGFNDPDTGRFYRDYLSGDVKGELEHLARRQEEPSTQVRLRSLLLNESPDALGPLAKPGSFSGKPADVLATCLALLQSSQPRPLQRLMASGPAGPFVMGLEREITTPNVELVQSLGKGALPAWPRPAWENWKTPTGENWHFGQVSPMRSPKPGKRETVSLNWNSQLTFYDLE